MRRFTEAEIEAARKGISATALRVLRILASSPAGGYVDGRVLRTFRSRSLVTDGTDGRVKVNQLGREVAKVAE